MKTYTYTLTGINNFHDSGPIKLRLSGATADGVNGSDVYIISPSQKRRLEKHFCGMIDCHCASGVVQQLDPDGTAFGIDVKRCSS